MGARRIDMLRQALGALALSVAASAGAAPLRLSLDSLAAAGPTGESVESEPSVSVEPADAPIAAEDLSFVVAPDLQFPDVAAQAGVADDDWLQTERAQQDEAAAADRSLGEFAPAATPVLTISTDPIDEVTLAAARSDEPASPGADAAVEATTPTWQVGAWMAAPLLALGAGVALWASRGARPAVRRTGSRATRRQAMQVV